MGWHIGCDQEAQLYTHQRPYPKARGIRKANNRDHPIMTIAGGSSHKVIRQVYAEGDRHRGWVRRPSDTGQSPAVIHVHKQLLTMDEQLRRFHRTRARIDDLSR